MTLLTLFSLNLTTTTPVVVGVGYCDQDDLEKRFGVNELMQLTDIDYPPLNAVNVGVLQAAIDDATAIINDYLVNYLPLPAVPARLKRVACDITRFLLYKDVPTDPVRRRFDEAIDYLEHIDLNAFGIGADDSGTPVIDTSNSIDISQGNSMFGQRQMRGFTHEDDDPFGLGRW